MGGSLPEKSQILEALSTGSIGRLFQNYNLDFSKVDPQIYIQVTPSELSEYLETKVDRIDYYFNRGIDTKCGHDNFCLRIIDSRIYIYDCYHGELISKELCSNKAEASAKFILYSLGLYHH